MFYLGLWCKRQRIAVPLSRVGINGDNAWLAVVNVIAQVLVQSQGNGCRPTASYTEHKERPAATTAV